MKYHLRNASNNASENAENELMDLVVVVSPRKTRRMAKSKDVGKENNSENRNTDNVNTRRRGVVKPLQDKKNTAEVVMKGNKKGTAETKSTTSSVTTRKIGAKGSKRSTSDDSENRVRLKRGLQKKRNENSETKPQLNANITPLTQTCFVKTRKMTALDGTAAVGIENKAVTKSIGKEADIDSESQNVAVKHVKQVSKPHSKKSAPVVLLVKTRRMAMIESSESKSPTTKLSKTKKSEVKSSKTQPKRMKGTTSVQHAEVDITTNTRQEAAAGNSATEPVYKKQLGDNANAIDDGIFDFESNSQENTAISDEPMKDVIEKLIRENKAVIKHKVKRKKGVTKAKQRVTHKELKVTDVKMLPSKLREIFKPTPKIVSNQSSITSHANIEQCDKPQESTKFIDPIESMVIETSPKPSEVQEVKEIVDFDDVATNVWSKPLTPARRLIKTYTAHRKTPNKSITPQHQSTPVRQLFNQFSSPWRVPTEESSIISEFSIIAAVDETKVSMEENKENPISSNRLEQQNQLLSINRKSANLQQIEETKLISDDIRNCFGFNSDDSDDDHNRTVTRTIATVRNRDGKIQRKVIPPIRESLPRIDLSVLNDKPAKSVNRANEKKITKQPAAVPFRKPNTMTARPVGKQTAGKASNRVKKNPVNEKKHPSEELFKESSFLRNWSEKPGSSKQDPSHNNNDDGPALFKTNWPVKEDKKYRSYTRVPQRKYDYQSIVTDDESEAGDVAMQQRHKRTKPKVDHKYEEELREFENEFNSNCKEVENYELVMEVSK